jgi:arylsulfatase A-like enzyme
MPRRPNIIVIVADTFRTAHLGCYGNPDIHTPHLDAFATESTLFEHAYPESLPTIPVRRTLHTGRRAFPFRDYKPVKWDIVYLPGWQAMSNDEDTVAENLADAGYHTGFVSDTFPYFAPGFNFTRGFHQWEYIRGQQQDRWKATAPISDEQVRNRYHFDNNDPQHVETMKGILANVEWQQREEDTSPARTFQWAMDFATDNRNEEFYLFVDCFDPHEPWEAPDRYYNMYRPDGYDGPTMPLIPYGPRAEFCSELELANILAHYQGLVTLVDEWFGRLIDRIKHLGIYDDSMIVFLSDHGTNFGEDPDETLGKPSVALYQGTMHIPLMVKLPGGEGSGQRIPALTSNLDVPATVCDVGGVTSAEGIHGQSLAQIINGKAESKWDYLTSRYDHHCWHFDGKHWVVTEVGGNYARAFELGLDGKLVEIHDERRGTILETARARILADASGELPDYRETRRTDAVGQERR